ncbi:MAG: hypothetical protein KGL74_14810, partial [Elusimicrobia bacterium]|nr:hypothetical protein [Elusimicrobiota bacterium]
AAIPEPKPAAERTASIGPDITIPGLNDLPDAAIELPQRSGVGPASAVPPPPKRTEDADATMRIEPTQSPDATLRLKPNPQEPS